MFNEDQSVWEAVGSIADAPGFGTAAFWLSSALWARHMWFITHDLKYAGQIADYTELANSSLKRGMEFRQKHSQAAA